jgi:hypothetical protein
MIEPPTQPIADPVSLVADQAVRSDGNHKCWEGSHKPWKLTYAPLQLGLIGAVSAPLRGPYAGRPEDPVQCGAEGSAPFTSA